MEGTDKTLSSGNGIKLTKKKIETFVRESTFYKINACNTYQIKEYKKYSSLHKS